MALYTAYNPSTKPPLLASALRTSPRHCAKGLPPNTLTQAEGEGGDGDGETSDWTPFAFHRAQPQMSSPYNVKCGA